MRDKELEESIYMLAAIETLINNNSSTDLGDYSLEYRLKIENIDNIWLEDVTDAALCIMVRSRNKVTNKIESGDFFYKIIEKHSSIEGSEKNKAIERILNMNLAQKLDFILRPEKLFSKSKFRRTIFFVYEDNFLAGAEASVRYSSIDRIVHYEINLPLKAQKNIRQIVSSYLKILNENMTSEDNKCFGKKL